MGQKWGRRSEKSGVEVLGELREETGEALEEDLPEEAIVPEESPEEQATAAWPEEDGERPAVVPGDTGLAGCLVLKLEVDRIVPNPAQPRRFFSEEQIVSLAESIQRYGVLQPLTVRSRSGEQYELVSGERRLRAAKLCGLRRVPCLLLETDERTSAELALIENLQRENLNLFEEAEAMGRLIAIYGLTQEQVAARLGCSQSAVANKIRLLRFTAEEQEAIVRSGLTERHARALLRVKDGQVRSRLLERVIDRGLTVAGTEELVDRALAVGEEQGKPTRRFVLKDVRIFYHSIDRAVELVRQAGIPIESERRAGRGYTEIVIKVPEKG